jgi:glutamate-5-semialdehyde dehydrogenase
MDLQLQETMLEQGKRARQAARILATTPSTLKDQGLMAMADALLANSPELLKANGLDLERGAASGLSSALLERLMLNEERIQDMAQGLREIAALPDPVGQVLGMTKRPNGLEVGRIRTPIGVVGIIYESRPNVTADAAGLCLKAGNAIILRGGEEALNSNRVIARVISEAAVKCGLPAGSIQLVDSEDKEAAIFLMKMSDYLDVLIPRGGKGLKMAVMENAHPFFMGE